jgi:CRP/FNR family transcriptional regulator
MLNRTYFDLQTATTLRAAVPRPGDQLSPCQACKVRDIVFCGALEEAELSALSSIKSVTEFEPNDLLFQEGEPADHFFNVTSGVIRVYKLLADGRRQITGFLFPGDFLGIANNDEYAYSAEAVTRTSVCRFRRGKLEAVLMQFPKLEHRLLSIASHELAAAQDQMMLLGRKTARERVASFLVMMSDRATRIGLPASPISVPMTRADIGDYLGLTTETVSRTISRLKRDGIIGGAPTDSVEVIDREQLEEISATY